MMVRVLLVLLLMASPGWAQTLRIALAAEPDSADPHHYALGPNSTLRDNLFEGLTSVDARGRVGPGLAVSWSRSDDLTWRFQMRTDVRFSNGAAFGAPDVVATFCRILNNRQEVASSFSSSIRRLKAVEAEGEGTLVIRTKIPEPLLLTDLAGLATLPRGLMPAGVRFDAPTACGGGEAWPSVADFNDGRAAIGTGPYRLVSYAPGGVIALERNPFFTRSTPVWANVRLTSITPPPARLASLLAGDQDLIEAPGTADIPRLRGDKRFVLAFAPTFRLVFVQLDVGRDPTPFIAGANPLRDVRVRQALSLALNRPALVERIMDGVAVPAAQYLPGNMPGTLPNLGVLPYDPVRARALLKEAGYPDGLKLVLHATNNRYVNDGPLAQAVAQQWQRIGVKAELDAMPGVSFFTRRSKRDFSVSIAAWSTDAGETLGFFRTWLASTVAAEGIGTSNYGGWSDPVFDAATHQAMATMDPDRRAALLREASARALEQMPVIPIQFQSAVWAMRAGLSYAGRSGETTLANEITESSK